VRACVCVCVCRVRWMKIFMVRILAKCQRIRAGLGHIQQYSIVEVCFWQEQ